MSNLTVRPETGVQAVDTALTALLDPDATPEDRAASWAVLHRLQLTVNRALRATKDDLIVHMEREGLRSMGPLSIRSSAVDPRYICNERENWEDAITQEALTALRADPAMREYVRSIPPHLEIDVDRMTEDMRLGVQGAIQLYRELNRQHWRVERDRRKSLVVREGRAT